MYDDDAEWRDLTRRFVLLFLGVLIFSAVAAFLIIRDGRAQEQHCRDLGGTPVVLYGRDECWPGGR